MAHQLAEGAYLKDFSAHFNQDTIPRELRAPGTLEKGMWARVVVEEGQLNLRFGKKGEPEKIAAARPAVIPPDTVFSLNAASGPVRFYLEYYHPPVIGDAAELASLLGRR